MILYAAEGQSNAEIARRLETAAEVVGRWRKRFFEERLAGLEDRERAGRPRRFPPGAGRRGEGTRVRAAGQTHGLPLSRFSRTELHRLVIERGVSGASASTIWRWLHDDALKPWQQRCWIFPRDPRFAEKAGRVLDLYQRRFEGRRLRPDELCGLRRRKVAAAGARPPSPDRRRSHPGRPARVEFEYRRRGTLAYLAAWDVHHARLFDRVEAKTGIEPFATARRAGDGERAVHLGAHRLLDRRQRQLTRRPGEHRPARGAPTTTCG